MDDFVNETFSTLTFKVWLLGQSASPSSVDTSLSQVTVTVQGSFLLGQAETDSLNSVFDCGQWGSEQVGDLPYMDGHLSTPHTISENL